MILKDFYDVLGGGYEAVKQRIPKDEIIERFVIKFLTEPSYQNLCDNLEKENYAEAFRAAHSLKGVSANLGFDRLQSSSSELTELLRGSEENPVDKGETDRLLSRVAQDYHKVIEAIQSCMES